MNSYNLLINKLDRFIKKYYKNKLLRGSIFALTGLLSVYLIVTLSEYFVRFSVPVRTFLFYTLFASFAFILIFLVIIPVSKLLKIGKLISYAQASNVISTHFPDIKDKLLNTLELQQLNHSSNSNILIEASIEQKINEIKIFPFQRAVSFRDNYKYLKYLIMIIFVFGIILVISPSILSESTTRIVNHSQYYEKPAPFKFLLINDTLTAKKGDDYTIKLKIKGKYVPEEVFINFGGNTFVMKSNSSNKSEFQYVFKNINNSLDFRFKADEYNSEAYKLNVLPAPVILKFKLIADVPSYTGEEDKIYENTGDIVVPAGTKLTWSFETKDIDSLQFNIKDMDIDLKSSGSVFSLQKSVFKNMMYSLTVSNNYFKINKLIDYQVTVIPDLYPSISVSNLQDTANFFINYFRGQINDDYGISKLTFNYRIVDDKIEPNDNSIKYQSQSLQFTKSMLKQSYFHTFDFSKFDLSDSKKIQYFFKVWDNDAIRGSKSAKTQISEFKLPSYKEVKDFENKATENISSKLEQSMKLAEELQNDMKNIQQKSLDGEMTQWEKSQMLQNILDKQKLLDELLKEAAKENKSKNKMQNTFNKKDKELLEKQKQIEKLMKKFMTDEIKELMKKIQELQKKFDQNKLNKLMKDHKFSYEDMEKQLERNLELLKRYEIEQKMQNAINEMHKLAKKQEKLSKETKNSKHADKDKLAKKQEDIKKQFDDLKKEYDKNLEKNKELKSPMKLDEMKNEEQEIKDEFQKSEKNISKGKSGKASESQSKNSKNMKKMAEKMQAMMDANSAQMNSENLETLRQIVDNIITFSFKQEELEKKFTNISYRDPKYMQFTTEQLELKEEYIHIKDSLQSLSERVPQINAPIQTEISKINRNINQTVKLFEERKKRSAGYRQHEIMTSANNLALLLSEVLKQMQNQQSGGGGGGQSKSKPKDGKKQAFGSLKQQQEALKKQMEKMLQQMKDGEGKFSKNAQNKQLAKMLAQQEIFRQMLKEMNAKQSLNPETQRMLNQINKMAKQNEKDLVNRKITPELLERQKKITTRLLEAEKSENKRKTENKRQAKEAEEKKYESAEDYFKKLKNNRSFKENLYRNNILLKNFYKNIFEQYYDRINN